MTEHKTLPSKIAAQDMVISTAKRGSLVARGLAAMQNIARTKDSRAVSAEEQYRRGLMHDHGTGVPQDFNEAVKWYRLAAEQGYAYAQFNLGAIYSEGEGVPQDNEEAMKWYRLAAAQGDAYAQVNLGAMYSNGHGVPQDYQEAVKWFRKAADQGDADGQSNLGPNLFWVRCIGKGTVFLKISMSQ